VCLRAEAAAHHALLHHLDAAATALPAVATGSAVVCTPLLIDFIMRFSFFSMKSHVEHHKKWEYHTK
jgi:hypothetical protein